MTPQQIAILFYLLSLTVVAPAVWFCTGPVGLNLITSKNPIKFISGLIYIGISIWATNVWYTSVIVPVLNEKMLVFTMYDWLLAIVIWPTAAFAGILLNHEWKRVKAEKAEAKK